MNIISDFLIPFVCLYILTKLIILTINSIKHTPSNIFDISILYFLHRLNQILLDAFCMLYFISFLWRVNILPFIKSAKY